MNRPTKSLTAEISMYPFNEDFIPAIDSFISKINMFSGLSVKTHETCTIVFGEYETVMTAIGETMAFCNEKYGKAVYVVKYLPGPAAP